MCVCVCCSDTPAHRAVFTAFSVVVSSCSRPRAALTTRSMRPSECRPGCHFPSNWRHKRAPRLPYWPEHPHCCRRCLFLCEPPRGNHLSNSDTLISCEIYMQLQVMKRCICAVAFPSPSADLQYKVKSTPWCQSFDRDGWSHCGCNKIKVLRVDIFVVALESRRASSPKYTIKKESQESQKASRRHFHLPVLCSVS